MASNREVIHENLRLCALLLEVTEEEGIMPTNPIHTEPKGIRDARDAADRIAQGYNVPLWQLAQLLYYIAELLRESGGPDDG